MEKQLNVSLLEGRLTKNPELISTGGGINVCKFDIAVNSVVKVGGETKNIVDFFSITTWSRLADACSKYLKKGTKVRVRGKLKRDSWVSKDGRKLSRIHIDASSVEFMGGNKRNIPDTEKEYEVTIPF